MQAPKGDKRNRCTWLAIALSNSLQAHFEFRLDESSLLLQLGMRMNDQATVFVVDDDIGMRESISYVLSKAEINSKEYASGKELLADLEAHSPRCMVVDFQMPDESGLKLMEQVRSRFGQVPFVLVTGHGTVPLTVEAMKLGAVTVLEKPFLPDEFLNSVREMLVLESQRRHAMQQKQAILDRMSSLTAREHEIAELVVAGSLTKQIAKQLGISTKTVEVHRSHITKKLGVESVAQLVNLVLGARMQTNGQM